MKLRRGMDCGVLRPILQDTCCITNFATEMALFDAIGAHDQVCMTLRMK
jgi:hypothetical protein